MKITILLLTLLNIRLLMAQEHPVKSDVYHWSDLEIGEKNSTVKKKIARGSTKHFEYFEICALTISPQTSVASQKNDSLEELIIVKEGALGIVINGAQKVLTPGGVVLILPGDNYSLKNPQEKMVAFYSLKYRSKTPMDINRGRKAGGSSMTGWNETAFVANDRGGGRRQFFERPTAALSRLEMHTTKLGPGLNSHAPHTHPEEEIVLLLTGQAEMQIGNAHKKVAPGSLVFLDSNVLHAISNTGATPCEYFAFSMRGFNK